MIVLFSINSRILRIVDKELFKEARKVFKNGNIERAAILFSEAGAHEEAMQAYSQLKRWDKAAEQALILGRGQDAAACLQRGHHFDRLGEFYSDRKDFEKAAQAYARAGDHRRASEAYEVLLRKIPEIRHIPGEPVNLPDETIRLFRLAASSHSRAGNHARAAHLYYQIGQYDEEGRNLVLAGEYRKAGEAYDRMNMFADAGYAYAQGGFFSEAAASYERDKNFKLAADHYLKAGEARRAGDLYLKVNDSIAAANAYESAGELDLAIKAAGNVPPDASAYSEAIEKTLGISKLKEYVTPSAKRFLSEFAIIADPEQHASTLYDIACLFVKSDFTEDATTILERLAAHSPDLLRLWQSQQPIQHEDAPIPSDVAFHAILREDFNADEREQAYYNRLQKIQELTEIDSSSQVSDGTLVSETPSETLASGSKPRTPLSFMHIQEGQQFGDRYQILKHLGSGGMGTVYKARDIELDEIIAIKILSPQLTFDENAVARFKQEIKLARQVNHPNIIRIFDLGELYGIKFITMEFFNGDQLKHIIQDQGFLSIPHGIRLLMDICSGLIAAHKVGVIHRDIKSQNIMVSEEGVAKILDFGIAKSNQIQGLTTDGSILGTPEYISPEAIMQKPVDARSDIYSLGMVMYEIFTGQLPFTGQNIMAIIRQHLYNDPDPPSHFNGGLPEELEDVIVRAIRRDPEDRYQSVAELVSELRFVNMAYGREHPDLSDTRPI